MIFKGSRYAGTEILTVPGPDGKERRVLALRVVPEAPAAMVHTVAEGERVDLLAARFYDEATKSWHILDANPEELNPFELLVPGRVIRIPRNRITSE